MSVRSDIKNWADIRNQGFKSYFTSQIVKMIKIYIKLYLLIVLIFIVVAFALHGFDPNLVLEALKISSVFLITIFIAPLLIYSTWKEKEKKYNQYLNNENDVSDVISSHSNSTEKIFNQYQIIKIFAHSMYILPVSMIIIAVLGSILDYKYSLIVSMVPGIFWLVIIKLLHLYFKNPICQHRIFSVDEKKRHPDAEGSYLDNIMQIIKSNEFHCFECNTHFHVIKRDGKDFVSRKV